MQRRAGLSPAIRRQAVANGAFAQELAFSVGDLGGIGVEGAAFLSHPVLRRRAEGEDISLVLYPARNDRRTAVGIGQRPDRAAFRRAEIVGDRPVGGGDDHDVALAVANGDLPAVRAAGHSEDRAAVKRQVGKLSPLREGDGPRAAVERAISEPARRLIQQEAVHAEAVSGEDAGLRPVRDAPFSHRAVIGGGIGPRAVRRQRHVVDVAAMAFDPADQRAGRRVPDSDAPVP